MKKKLFIGIMAFFAVAYIIFTIFFPHYNPIFFYIQHISLFILIIMFLVYILKLAYDSLSTRKILGRYLKWVTLVLFIGLLFVFSNAQLYYIENFQTPTYYNCKYYDEYDNLIYVSEKNSTCPTLEAKEQTPTRFTFSVLEEFDDKYYERAETSFPDESWINYKANVLTNITITYDNLGNIITQDLIETTFIETDLNGKSQFLNSYKLSVVNVYNLEGETKSFTSKQKLDIYTNKSYSFNDVSDVRHLSDLEYKTEYHEHKSVYDGSKIILTHSKYNELDESDKVVTHETEWLINWENNHMIASNDKADISIDISKEAISFTYTTYLYTESDIPIETTTYSKFKDMDYVFESSHHTLENTFNQGVDRESFRYLGNDYLQHGNFYTVFERTDFGRKLTRKSSQVRRDSEYLPITYIMHNGYENGIYSYDKTLSIYDYKSNSFTSSGEYGEIMLQKNPLIYTFFDVE